MKIASFRILILCIFDNQFGTFGTTENLTTKIDSISWSNGNPISLQNIF